MHVAILGSQSSIHIVRWANALVEKGIKVDVITMHNSREEFHPSVNVIRLYFKNPYGYVLNILQLRILLKKIKPDFLHVFYAFGHGFLGRMSGYKPLLLSVMGSDVFDDVYQSPIYKTLIIKNIIDADVVCSTSVVMKYQIEKLVGQRDDIKITPFGVDIESFSKHDHSQNDEDFVLGTVKWMAPKYGIDILIKAFAKFCNYYPNKSLKLILVGDGPQMEELISLAKELGVLSKCDFVGSVKHEEVPIWLSKFDVYLALSRLDSESFGVAILEASAMGLPVIVSDVGGLPEVVIHEKTGIIVPKENINETFNAIVKLYEDKNLMEKLGKNGRKHVEKSYSWEESINKMVKIYELFE